MRNIPQGFYHGMLVNKSTKVLVGPAVIFCLEAKTESPAELREKPDATDRALEKMAIEAEQERAAAEKEAEEIPDDVLALAREKAGTRAEVLDLNDICISDPWRRQVKSGYALLKGGWGDDLRYMDDPEECTERCTHGFHYGFDSKDNKGTVYFICTDTKCIARKKAAFTRKKNAEGQARKKAETKAIREAIAQTTTLDKPRMKLILLAQMDGLHTSRSYYYGAEGATKKPEKWLWDKVSAGTADIDRTRATLFKAIDRLSDEQLAQLLVEFMFYYLTDKGDIGTYTIKADEPLKWMGVEITLDGDKDNA